MSVNSPGQMSKMAMTKKEILSQILALAMK